MATIKQKLAAKAARAAQAAKAEAVETSSPGVPDKPVPVQVVPPPAVDDKLREQTAIRMAMLANGYAPLANKEKMTLIEGWPQLVVDEELVAEWESSRAFRSTGLRIDPPLVAVDIDIDDKTVVAALWEECEARFGKSWADRVLIRGRDDDSPKECWVFRVDEPFPTTGGARYVKPGDDPDAEGVTTHRVELFGGGSGKQIGAYGAHTPGLRPEDPPLVSYQWLGDQGPHNVKLEALPELSKADVYAIVTLAGDLMREAGWHMTSPFAPGENSGETRYDLTRDATFVVDKAGTVVSFDELGSHKHCRMREITGEGSNTERGRVYLDDAGIPFVWDSATLITHILDELEPRDMRAVVIDIAAKLRELYPERMAEMEARHEAVQEAESIEPGSQFHTWRDIATGAGERVEWELLQYMVDSLCARFVFYPTGKPAERVVDAFTGETLSKDGFIDLFRNSSLELETLTPAGNPVTKWVNPAERWFSADNRVEINGFRYTPGDTTTLFEDDDGRRYLNSWRPFELSLDGYGLTEDKAAALRAEAWSHMVTLVEHAVPKREPDEDDLDDIFADEWLLAMNFLCCVVRFPNMRGTALVIAGETNGVGKGVLSKLMAELVGPGRCITKGIRDILGTSAAAAHPNEELVRAQLVVVKEANTPWSARSDGAEAMKSLIAPDPEQIELNPKGRDAYSAFVHFSTVIFSNNPFTALPITVDSRRESIVAAGGVKFENNPAAVAAAAALLPKGTDALDPEKATRARMLRAALFEVIMALPLVGEAGADDAPFALDTELWCAAPRTAARALMVEGGEGPLEDALRTVLGGRLTEGREGVLLDEVIDAVYRKAGKGHGRGDGVALATVKVRVKELLGREAGMANGETLRGFAGWVWKSQVRVLEPEGVTFETGGGLSLDRGTGAWRMKNLVMRETLAEPDADKRARGQAVADALKKSTHTPAEALREHLPAVRNVGS